MKKVIDMNIPENSDISSKDLSNFDTDSLITLGGQLADSVAKANAAKQAAALAESNAKIAAINAERERNLNATGTKTILGMPSNVFYIIIILLVVGGGVGAYLYFKK